MNKGTKLVKYVNRLLIRRGFSLHYDNYSGNFYDLLEVRDELLKFYAINNQRIDDFGYEFIGENEIQLYLLKK